MKIFTFNISYKKCRYNHPTLFYPKMKRLLVLALTLVVAHGLTPEQIDAMKKQIMDLAGQCQGETGTTAADLTELMQEKKATTKMAKCFLFCMHKKIKFQDDSGKLDMAGIERWLNDLKRMDATFGSQMKQVADSCIPNINDSGDPCDTAAITYDCYTKESAKIGAQMII